MDKIDRGRQREGGGGEREGERIKFRGGRGIHLFKKKRAKKEEGNGMG